MEVEPFKVYLWSSIRHTPGLHRQRPWHLTKPQQGLCHHQHETANLRKGYTEAYRLHGCSKPLYITPRQKETTVLQTPQGLRMFFLVGGGRYSFRVAQVVSNKASDHDGTMARQNSPDLHRRYFSRR